MAPARAPVGTKWKWNISQHLNMFLSFAAWCLHSAATQWVIFLYSLLHFMFAFLNSFLNDEMPEPNRVDAGIRIISKTRCVCNSNFLCSDAHSKTLSKVTTYAEKRECNWNNTCANKCVVRKWSRDVGDSTWAGFGMRLNIIRTNVYERVIRIRIFTFTRQHCTKLCHLISCSSQTSWSFVYDNEEWSENILLI